MRAPRFQRFDWRFIFVLCVATPIALLTQFQNQISIRLSSAEADSINIVLTTPQDKFEAKLPFGELREIKGSFQRSMAGNTALAALSATGENQKTELIKSSGIYLFGTTFGRGFINAVVPNFVSSFGDWTIDRFESAPLSIARLNLALPLTLDATVLGRGTTNLYLIDEQLRQIKISLDDGFIDNAVHICNGADCSTGGQLNESVGLNIARIVNVFAQACIFAGLMWLAVSILAMLSRTQLKSFASAPVNVLTIIIIVLHTVAIYAFANRVLGSIAHLPDSSIYVRQAILLGHGMISAALPPAQPYEAFLSNSAVIEGGAVLYRHASHFWPLFLAPFARLGAMALVNPVLAFISIFSLAYLVRIYWGINQACLAVLLYALSPFVFVNYGDFMMHGFCSTLVMLSAACVTRFEQSRHRKWCLLAGFFAGYCFGTRQITAIALGVPLLFVWLLQLRARNQFTALRLFFLGALPCALGFLYDNYLVTGSPWRSIYAYLHGLSLSFANLPVGIGMSDSMLGYLGSILLPSIVPSFALGLAVFGLFAEWSRRSLVLAGLFMALLLVHFFLNTNGLHGYGPRFLFEASPALIVLAALGIYSCLKRAPIWGGIFLTLYLGFAIIRLVRGLPQYRDYNGVLVENFKAAQALPAKSTILVVHGDSWQTLDTYAGLFDPTWKGLLVLRTLDGNAERPILEALSDRRVHEIK